MSGISKTKVQKERLKSAIDSGEQSIRLCKSIFGEDAFDKILLKNKPNKTQFEKLVQKKRFAIGIDVGIINGFSVFDRQLKRLQIVKSCKLFELFIELQEWDNKTVEDIEVFIENPNTWKVFTKPNPKEQQGAGAVKQTYKHIIEFLDYKQIPYTPTKVQGNLKKLNRATFEKITKWDKVTNEHARDSAMIVFNR